MVEKQVPLTEAAQALAISWQRAWRLLLTGALRGEKRNGHWHVAAADVERLRAATPKTTAT